ncbi:unnamed protein product [Peronospora belbahrii]|uniref:Uncharacterized protein n=1 Tax=Peronospora belbahrii TaxID=622444 RepID=A0ABN8D277_9STRA|nr:unnamed protein product [Peronospora belbahrii]
MEKDLRDAYAALKLLRADLVKTRREKQSLEAFITHTKKTERLSSSAVETRANCEVQEMQSEDMNSQLWRLAFHYENQLQMERQERVMQCKSSRRLRRKMRASRDSSGSVERGEIESRQGEDAIKD